MTNLRTSLLVGFVALLFILEGTTSWWFFSGSWNSSLGILNMALISAIMALGVNLQWGYAGLFNIGIMGFVALGGLASVLISMPPTTDAWAAGGPRVLLGLVMGVATVAAAILIQTRMVKGQSRTFATVVVLVGGFFLYRFVFDAGVIAVEDVTPAATGYLGGLGLPVILAWPVGGLLAAGAAWIIGKTALGLRSDYLAIATLGIAEIIIAVLKNEDWLSRGVKNVNGIPRPAPFVPYEVDLQVTPWFLDLVSYFGFDVITASTITVKLIYGALFTVVLLILLWLAQKALKSPWGRMMRAIRDNEVSAEAMGKDVKGRHLQIFILGSAVCGIAGAMMATLDGQLTPGTYAPLRFTFLIWVMVIVGGSGNNFGSVLGAFIVYFLWIKVETIGQSVMDIVTMGMTDGSWLKFKLLESVAYMRLLTMGLLLLLILRFSPRGLIPEK